MRIRARSSNGDILPILHISDMLSGSEAVALLVEERLKMFCGEWWENPDLGNKILRMLQEGRLTEADSQSLSTYLSDFVRKTEGVLDVKDESFSYVDRVYRWECTVLTDFGQAAVSYSI